MEWTEWNPGLDNDADTLGSVYATLPGLAQEQINWLVQLLENPRSPLALTGAIDLFAHDCVHILLGRGLLAQDEAFVIGFTMGTSKTISRFQRAVFKFAARFLYPKIYRFTAQECRVFELGIEAGKLSACSEIYDVDFRRLLSEPLGKIRRMLGIDTEFLRFLYEKEVRLLPNTTVSRRLPKQVLEPEPYAPQPFVPPRRANLSAKTIAA